MGRPAEGNNYRINKTWAGIIGWLILSLFILPTIRTKYVHSPTPVPTEDVPSTSTVDESSPVVDPVKDAPDVHTVTICESIATGVDQSRCFVKTIEED